MKQKVYTHKEVKVVARKLCALMTPGSIMTFVGPLGAGKTTLVREMLQEMGITKTVTSPTFGYVNTYSITGGDVHHFDLYRISDVEQFCQLGFEEYLADQQAMVLIEWPAVIEVVLQRHLPVIKVQLAYDPKNVEQRTITVQDC